MRSSKWSLMVTAAFVVAACGNSSEQASATSTAAASTAAASASAAAAAASASAAAAAASASAAAAADKAANVEQEGAQKDLHGHHRHHHHGGVTMFIHMAIDSLGVAPEKKAQLEKIQADLHAKMAPSREAGRAVLQLLADGVKAGKIDDAKVDAAVKKQEAASAAVHAATQDALNQLHELLSPAERAALVDKIKAHAEVWKKVNQDEEHGAKAKGSHLAKLTEELSLTPDQVEKISAALTKDAPKKGDWSGVENHLKAFETAFVADKFDAKTLATTANGANTYISKNGTGRLVRFYRIVTPLLTPDQRTKLAAHLAERLNDKQAAK